MKLPGVRFTVRGALALVLAVACGMGWFVGRARVQADAVAAIERAGGQVRYDWQVRDGRMVTGRAPAGPAWLARLLGPHHFDTVTDAFLPGRVTDADMAAIAGLGRVDTMVLDPRGLSDEGLSRLGEMTGLRWLTITGGNVGADARIMPLRVLGRLQGLTLAGTDVSDAGLRTLPVGDGLEQLDLSRTGVTDEGLARLGALPGLRHLYLEGTGIGDDGLIHLAGLTSLEALHLKGTVVTTAGVARLRQALPKLTINLK